MWCIYVRSIINPDINFFDAFEGLGCVVHPHTRRRRKNDSLDTSLSIFLAPLFGKERVEPELIFLADSRFGTDISGENPELISFGRP